MKRSFYLYTCSVLWRSIFIWARMKNVSSIPLPVSLEQFLTRSSTFILKLERLVNLVQTRKWLTLRLPGHCCYVLTALYYPVSCVTSLFELTNLYLQGFFSHRKAFLVSFVYILSRNPVKSKRVKR